MRGSRSAMALGLIGLTLTALAALVPTTATAISPSPQVASTSVVTWAKMYNGTGASTSTSLLAFYARSARQTSDGGYIVVGRVAVGCCATHGWLFRLDSVGNVAWSKTYNGTGFEDLFSVQQTSDGGFIATGQYHNSTNVGALCNPPRTPCSIGKVWLLRTDGLGNIVWQKTYGDGIAFSVQQTTDGGFVVAGATRVLRLDSLGNVVWEKMYALTGAEVACSVQQTTDGGFIVAGAASFSGAPCIATISMSSGSVVWVFKLDSLGNIVWQKTYGGTVGGSKANSARQTSDGGYIVAGQTNAFNQGSAGGINAWVLRLNSLGNVVWQKTYGGSSFDVGAADVWQTSDGGFVVAGQISFNIATGQKAWVLRLDSLGSIVWENSYETSGSTYTNAYSVQQTTDGGFIVGGERITNVPFSTTSGAWILKLNSKGSISHCSLVVKTSATAIDSAATVNPTTATVTDTAAVIDTPSISVKAITIITSTQCPSK